MPHHHHHTKTKSNTMNAVVDEGHAAIAQVTNAARSAINTDSQENNVQEDGQHLLNHITETGRQTVEQAKEAAAKKVAESQAKLHQAQEKVIEAYHNAQEGANGYVEKGKQVIGGARVRASSISQNLQESAHKVGETTKQAARPYVDSAMKTAEPYVEAARPYVDKARQTAQYPQKSFNDAKEAIRERTHQYVETSKGKITHLKERIVYTAEPVLSEVNKYERTPEGAVRLIMDAARLLLVFVYSIIAGIVAFSEHEQGDDKPGKGADKYATFQVKQLLRGAVRRIVRVGQIGLNRAETTFPIIKDTKQRLYEQMNVPKTTKTAVA